MSAPLCCMMDIRTLKEEELAALTASLPPERAKKIEAMRQRADKLRSAGAALILRYCLGAYGLPEDSIRYAELGRPFVRGREDLFVTLSHSGDYALGAIGPSPLSVDIQDHDGGTEAIVRRAFSPREQSWYRAAGDEAGRRQRFYDIWCRKECLAKLDSYEYVRDIDSFSPAPGYRYFGVPPIPGYSLALYAPEAPAALLALEWDRSGGFRQRSSLPFLPQDGPWQGRRKIPV